MPSATEPEPSLAQNGFQRTMMSTNGKASNASSLHDHNGAKEISDTIENLNAVVFPDGGLRAWLIVGGAFCTTFSTFGFVNAWGVFQAYYETHLLKHVSSSNIAWIGSMQYALVFLPAVVVGRLFDLGWFHLPFAIGSGGLVLSAFLIAQCTQYWHFVLTQGLLVGLSCGICFGPIIGLVGHWFHKKRGLALAITTIGSSCGGTVIPIVARLLIPKIGFQWTMRVIGFILISILGVSNLALRRRIPPKAVAGGLFNFNTFKSPAFTTYCLSTFVAYLGVYTLLTFVDVSAIAAGIPEDFSFYLVSISNAASGVGRLAVGVIVDSTGPVNVSVPMMVIAALVTYLWPLAQTKNAYIAITVLYGFSSAAYVATFQMPAYGLGDIEDVGRRAGMVMTFAAFGAIAGPPISGSINHATGGFSAVGYYAGVSYSVPVCDVTWTPNR